MQVFIKIKNKLITLDFENNITKIKDLISMINLKENVNITEIYYESKKLDEELIMTKNFFCDFVLYI